MADWRDTFCGRENELKSLIARYEEVAAGKGPRLAVVLGDRGMGKTRLVQELYRTLTTDYDPQDYWPAASLFEGNNLRVAPELTDPEVRAHFESFKVVERPMPFLWWGFRLADPDVRNAARSDMAAHRMTLEPHLTPVRFARQVGAARERMRQASVDAASTLGKSLLMGAVNAIPGVGAVATVADLFLNYAGIGKEAAEAAREDLHLREVHRESNLLESEEKRTDDIHERTLDDVIAVLAPAEGATSLPVVVFCDDAQFAREGGDEGALRFLSTLWQRAHLADWPLLLVLTHWAADWHLATTVTNEHNCASELGRDARSPHVGLVIDLPKESALAELVKAGLPGLPDQDVTLLLGKADGNPQVLIELVELARRSPAWRRQGTGELTPHARREIDRRATSLAGLILERLESDVTPETVRQAVALSSLQGMQFLFLLTDAAAQAFELSGVTQGLGEAQDQHRLVVGIDKGVSGFVQRAYREAAASLVGGHVGDPQDVEHALLNAAIALVDNADRWSGLTPYEQTATWGVVIGLAEAHADVTVRRYAGMGLLRLIGDAVQGDRGADYARAAELALRFEAGLGSRWNLTDFDAGDMRRALDAISTWHGPARTANFSLKLLSHARELTAQMDTPQSMRDLAVSLNQVGAVARAQGEWVEAEKVYREGLEISRELVNQLGTSEAQRDVAISLHFLGILARAKSDWADMEKFFRESLEIRRDLASKLGTPEAQRDVSLALHYIGIIARVRGDWPGAEKAYRESLAIRRGLAAKVGTPKARRDLSVSLANMGVVGEAQGDWVAAENNYRESLEIRRELAATLGTPESQRDASLALNYMSAVAKAKGEWAEAERLYRESLGIRRELAARLGTPGAKSDLAASLTKLGSVVEEKGDWLEAEMIYGESLQIRRALVAKLDTPKAQRGLSVSLNCIGAVAKAKGEWAKAEEVYLESLTIRRALAARLGTPGEKGDLAASLNNVGMVAEQKGEWAKAEKVYRESLGIRRELAGSLGTPGAQRRLSVSLNHIFEVAKAKGDRLEAESACRECLEIRRDLAAKLGTPDAKRELGLTLRALGAVLREGGRVEESCNLLREAEPIFEALAKNLNTPRL